MLILLVLQVQYLANNYIDKARYENDRKTTLTLRDWDSKISTYVTKSDLLDDIRPLVKKHDYDIFVKATNAAIKNNKDRIDKYAGDIRHAKTQIDVHKNITDQNQNLIKKNTNNSK